MPVNLNILFYVVDNGTMNCNCLLGRNFINNNSIKLSFNKSLLIEKVDAHNDYIFDDIMLIVTVNSNSFKLDINSNLCVDVQERVNEIFEKHYIKSVRPVETDFQYEMEVRLKKYHIPFYFRPRPMSYSEKKKIKMLINELLLNKIIRPNNSSYCSPIVLVK